MIVHELRNTNLSDASALTRSAVGLFATIAGAQQRAEEEMAKYLAFAIEEAVDPEVHVTPMTTALAWETRVLPTRFPTRVPQPPTWVAQYDRDYGFTITEVAVGP